MIQTLTKGDRVVTTGYGRTKNWGNVIGKVTHRRGEKVFVQWEGTSFLGNVSAKPEDITIIIEDEMDIKEVRPDE
ncbi:MAG: hypothetical protein Q8O17_02210 [Candidatus Methanoperedens sp.]|nr:hypothetical protein [Candidatus Methanoperedens sp.]